MQHPVTLRRHLAGGAAIVLALTAGVAASAQSVGPAPTAGNTADTAPAPSGIEDIIVTGRLRKERLQDAPLAVTALSGNLIKQEAISDISGITRLVPVMVVGRQVSGSGASIFLRGVGSSSLSAGFDQSVALNLDGIAMTRGRELINAQYDLQQVEVLKGPQALFFGKNSTGGVVSITTAGPTDHFEASVRAGYEFVADERYGEGVVSGPITDNLGFRIAVRASKMDGYFDNVAQANVTNGFLREPASTRLPYGSTISGRLTLVYDDHDGFKATFKGSGTHIKDSGVFYERRCGGGRTQPIPTFGILDPYQDCNIDGRISTANIPQAIASTMQFQRSDGQTYDDHKSGVAMLRLDKELGKLSLTSITGYYAYNQHDANSFAGATVGIYSGQHTRFKQFSEELRLLTNFDGPINMTAGAFYAHGRLHYDYDSLVFVDPVDPATGRYDTFRLLTGFTSNTYSAFGELNWKITPQIELAGGARISREERDSYVNQTYVHPAHLTQFAIRELDDRYRDTNVSPQATITWKPTEQLTLYGAYKQGFKTGGFNNSIAVTPATQISDGRFKAEKAKGGEIGLRGRFLRNALSLNVTAYDYDYNGLQVQTYNATTQSQTVQNVGSLNVKGIELEALFEVPGVNNLLLRGATAYNDATLHDFLGACFTGETPAQGCNKSPNAAGVFQTQDLEGRTPVKAPKWGLQGSVSYDFAVTGSVRMGLSGGAQYSSRYNISDALRPDGFQPAYTRWDGAIRLFNSSRRWELALIGRNLTNKLVITSANDGARQGSGTGTPAGSVGDLNAIVERGREVHLEFTFKL